MDYIALVLVALGLFLTIFSFAKKKFKKRAGRVVLGVVGVGFVVLSIVMFASPGWTSMLNVPLALAPGVQENNVPQQGLPAGTLCTVEDTTVTLSSSNKYTSTATGGTHRYRINGAPALTVANAGTFTASPGDVLQILWMNGTESRANFFADVSTETVPCSGTKTFDKELYSNGTVTMEVFNEEGNLINTLGENETVSAGDVVTLTMKLKGQYQRAFPYGGVIVAEYPASEIDDLVIDLGGSSTSSPQFFHANNGSQSIKAYTIPAFFGTDTLVGSLTIDVDDTVDPTAVLTDVINMTFYGNDYFVNEDTGGSYSGPAIEDEKNTQTKLYSSAYAVALD